MKFIIGEKKKMGQIFKDDKMIPVTQVKAGPCFVAQIKSKEKDGYQAVQLGFREVKKRLKKPQKGHLKNLPSLRYLKEFRLPAEKEIKFKRGDKIDVSIFEKGEKVDVVGISKGKGFTGVVKRYGFKDGPKTHGQKHDLRMPGSIGATGPQRVLKGKKMPGRMGNKRVTIKNLEIIDIDKEKNLLLIKGGLPGAYGSLLLILSKDKKK